MSSTTFVTSMVKFQAPFTMTDQKVEVKKEPKEEADDKESKTFIHSG